LVIWGEKMIVANCYPFNGGDIKINKDYPHLLDEVKEVIRVIDAESCRLKTPKDKEILRAERIGETKFYSPSHLNSLFDYYLLQRGWFLKPRVKTNDKSREGYREMDALKEKLGVEVQFGKYAFLTYDIVAKMVIFQNLKIIDCGIEICPMSCMLPHMSSGIGAFEQVVWDLAHRGAKKGFDVPVIVIGVETEKVHKTPKPSQPELIAELKKPIILKERYKVLNAGTIKKLRETGIDV
jgi:hypothetical protein